jgi:hypothetical protein
MEGRECPEPGEGIVSILCLQKSGLDRPSVPEFLAWRLHSSEHLVVDSRGADGDPVHQQCDVEGDGDRALRLNGATALRFEMAGIFSARLQPIG